MIASIPANEMAQTLRVLAGENAVNAARHFTRCSYYLGDACSVELWSRTIQVLVEPTSSPKRPAILAAEAVTQSRLVRERLAFQGVRYEEVDATTLALEEPPAIVVPSPDEWSGRPRRFGFVRTAKAASHAVIDQMFQDRADTGLAQVA